MNSITSSNKNISFSSSLTIFSQTNCQSQISASKLLIDAKTINIFSTIIIIVIGLIGNGLAVYVFSQKRFRLHSSRIYLLCLAISDGMFLIIHFFEDTLRTYIDVYLNIESDIDPNCYTNNQNHANNSNNLLRQLNITDRFLISCRIVNYFRYFLRFISAYIIVSFTIQRAIAIYSPFYQSKFKRKRMTWAIVTFIVLVSAILNLWVPIFFNIRIKLNGDLQIEYCDIDKEYSTLYFSINIVYVALILFFPIIVIFFCNILVIKNLIQANKNRSNMLNATFIDLKVIGTSKNSLLNTSTVVKPIMSKTSSLEEISLIGVNLMNNKGTTRLSHSNPNTTRMLLLMSFSYSILNLPYFVSWSMFFLRVAFNEQLSLVERFKMFSILNICEIFYILDYAIHFFIYCAAGKQFRGQLKNAFK